MRDGDLNLQLVVRKYWVCLVAALLLSACEQPSPQAIRFGLSSAVVTLDPRFATDASSSRLCRLIYDSLVRFDENFKPVPGLATWRVETPLRYIFTLEGTRSFHDGSPLTAADVVATYQSILDAATASPHRGSLSLIENISALDESQVLFELTRAEPLFPGLLTIGVMSETQLHSGRDSNNAVIGSGPFRVSGKWTDKQVSLLRLRDEQIVRFETISDPTVRALKLLNGEIDLLQGGMAPEIVAWLGRRQGVTSQRYPGTTFTYLGMNLEDEQLSEVRVRRALALAINRDEIADHLFSGRARLASSIFTPEHWVYHDGLTGLAYEPEQARTILNELGFNAENPLRLTYKTSSDLFRLRVASVLQDQLAKVNILIDIQSFDWGTFYGDIKAGRFQLYSLSWVGLKLPDMFRYVFHSDAVPPEGANRGRFSSNVVDSSIERAEQAGSMEKRLGYYQDIQQQILEELPYVPLWYEDHVVVRRDEIVGYSVGLDGNYDALAAVRRETRQD